MPEGQGKAGRLPSKALFHDGTYDLDEFKRVFLETKDIFEYKAAIKLVGSWDEWNRLKRDWPKFADYVADWTEELKVVLQSEAMEKIIQLSNSTDNSALTASRFIVQGKYEGLQSKQPKRGRPSKDEVRGAARSMARDERDEQEELKRVRESAIGKK